jgi:molybdenum cofactor cytidylyltransferase
VADVALILLAAGCSRRMGRPKQLLPVNGVPMLRHATMRALESRCRPVVVVCGSLMTEVGMTVGDLPVRIVQNSAWQGGTGTSIHAGIHAVAAGPVDAAIVALADQPMVSGSTYDRLVGEWERRSVLVAASEYEDGLGAPALFDRRLFGELLRLPPDQGCKKLIERIEPHDVARCHCPEAAFDIDTPGDYEILEDSLSNGQ